MRRLTQSRGAMACFLLSLAVLPGCQFVGMMLESERRTGKHTVFPAYEGLNGESFAVLVSADRVIQAEHPALMSRLTAAVTGRLVNNTNATGVVPAAGVVRFQLNHPNWAAMTYKEISEILGADRLVLIEIYEHRLNEPGNRYVWAGLTGVHLGVVETDSTLPDEFVFSEQLAVGFPDAPGYGPNEYTKVQVEQRLINRIIDRITWLFYEHEEPNEIAY